MNIADTKIPDELLETLRRCDTRTVCNAIEVGLDVERLELAWAAFEKVRI